MVFFTASILLHSFNFYFTASISPSWIPSSLCILQTLLLAVPYLPDSIVLLCDALIFPSLLNSLPLVWSAASSYVQFQLPPFAHCLLSVLLRGFVVMLFTAFCWYPRGFHHWLLSGFLIVSTIVQFMVSSWLLKMFSWHYSWCCSDLFITYQPIASSIVCYMASSSPPPQHLIAFSSLLQCPSSMIRHSP